MIDANAGGWGINYKKFRERELKRAQKFSIILERFISPEGTFPVIGRSTPYRMAAMQPLALMAFMPLGLPANHPFWTDAPQPWTQVKAWGGQPFPKDHRWSD